MMKATRLGRFWAIAACACAFSIPGEGFAAEGIIEEIVVTARLRAESLQDAPVAVTAITGDTLQRLNLVNLADISQITPGVLLRPGRSDALFIRGVGSGGDTGFDQSVSIVIDEIPFSRGRWLNQAYFDVGQIEVLKGPQGVYLGKNATAGAAYLSTRSPTDEREIEARLGYEFEAREAWGEFVASGPLGDTFGARLAVRVSDQDGWFRNIEESEREPDAREIAGRLTLSWDISESLGNVMKISVNDLEQNAINAAQQRGFCPGATPQPIFGIIPAAGDDCRVDGRSTLDGNAPSDYGSGRWWEHESWMITNRLEWDLGDYVLTSITGVSKYETDYQDDYDYTSAPSIYAYEEESNDQWSQELRIATRWSGAVNLLGGVSYEETDFSHRNSSVLFNQTVLDVFAGLAGLPPGSFPMVDPATGRSFLWDRSNQQDGRAFAAYGEIQWEINDQWRLDIGGRYTDIRKRSSAANTYVHPIQGLFFALAPEGQLFADRYDDDDFSPQVTVSWRPADNLMFFASYTEAFKAGGFAHGSTLTAATTVDQITFDAESAEGFNLGMKGDFLERALRVSAVAFYNKYTDLQQSVFDSATTSFVVANAGENITQGVDLNVSWWLDERWSITADVSYLDTKIKDFFGACFAGQTVEQGCDQDFNPVTGRFSTRDFHGFPLRQAPEWETHLGIAYVTTFDNGLGLSVNLEMIHVDERDFDRQRGYVADAITRWDASVSISGADGRWLARLYGKNLTDEYIIASIIDSPGTGGSSGLPASNPAAGRWADGTVGIFRTREVGLGITYRLGSAY
jgi:iron complex outermembrane recepter protein